MGHATLRDHFATCKGGIPRIQLDYALMAEKDTSLKTRIERFYSAGADGGKRFWRNALLYRASRFVGVGQDSRSRARCGFSDRMEGKRLGEARNSAGLSPGRDARNGRR